MSDTERNDKHKKWYSKEGGWARRVTRRMERHKGKDALRYNDPDFAGQRMIKRTQGGYRTNG